MPELPEVEVLVRHLAPLVKDKTIRRVHVHKPKVLKPTSARELEQQLSGATIQSLTRRGKYLVFTLRKARKEFILVGHLGMTGRMFVQPKNAPLPKHTSVRLELNRDVFIYEDPRMFGRLTFDTRSLDQLGPEPWSKEFSVEYFAKMLARSAQPVKVKLLDQSLVAGVGNIYASEALFRAKVSPKLAAKKLTLTQIKQLHRTVRDVMQEAIDCGSTIPLDFSEGKDGLFYFGQVEGNSAFYEERLRVYDRAGKPCIRCRTKIVQIVQAARSTYFCPQCQR